MPIVEKRTITPRRESFKSEKTREEQRIDSLSPHLTIMIKAARKTGFRLIRDFGEISNLQVSRKGPGDFVTNADLMAEKTLIEQLSAAREDYGFISEERGVIPAKNKSPFTWVIDPIDGTTNFMHAIDEMAISVALMEHKTVVAGIVYNPIRNELYYAEKGKGAFLMTPTMCACGCHRATKRKKRSSVVIVLKTKRRAPMLFERAKRWPPFDITAAQRYRWRRWQPGNTTAMWRVRSSCGMWPRAICWCGKRAVLFLLIKASAN